MGLAEAKSKDEDSLQKRARRHIILVEEFGNVGGVFGESLLQAGLK
jgi:hypothetical protein